MPPQGLNQVMSPQLIQAMQMRVGGNPVPALDQTAQSAPPTVPSGTPSAMPPQAPMKQSSSESELIVKALGQRLGAISKTEEQERVTSPQNMPVGF